MRILGCGGRIYGPVSGLPHGDPRMHVFGFWAHFRVFQFVVNFRVWGVGDSVCGQICVFAVRHFNPYEFVIRWS